MQANQADRVGDRVPRRRRPLLFAALALGLLLVLAAGLQRILESTSPGRQPVALAPATAHPAGDKTASPQSTPSTPAPAPAGAMIAVEQEPEAPPLPALEHSDPEVRTTLADILPAAAQPALAPDQLLQRATVLAANFARGKLLRDKLPLPAPGGKLAVTLRGERIYLAEANFARYNALADLLAQLDVEAFARWFTRYEPLFGQAWNELGAGEGNARSALVAGLDLALTAPDLQGEIELVQPSVFYKFADPALEALPDTQKLLIRIGPANRTLVKQRLRRLRDALAARP